jgi:hypothetical protein
VDHCNPKTDTLAEDYVNYARDFSVGKEKSSWGIFWVLYYFGRKVRLKVRKAY